MEVRFGDRELERLATDSNFTGGYSQAVVKTYRMRIQAIRAAVDERDFYAMKSWHFEKLKGARSHQCSMRLNDQWRLILQIEGKSPNKIVLLVRVEDYH